MPNCTIIKTGATITRAASQRATELKSLIDAIEMPYDPHYAGDAVLYDAAKDKLVFASADADFASQYPASQYVPIGVVAVPNAHDVYGKHKCGVVSLKAMSYSTPDDGATSNGTMYWGYNSLLLGKAYSTVVQTGTIGAPSVEATEAAEFAYMPSDNFSGDLQCPTDAEAFYYNSGITTYTAAPSPYLEDGSRNPVYYQTTDPSNETNCLSDFDGVANTQLILDAVTVSDWQTSSAISNSSSRGNYPSACCCWRYCTDGTSQGDWYLPACGELGYMMARLKKINETIGALVSAYGNEIGVRLQTTSYYWSSSEDSSAYARRVDMGNGNVSSSDKGLTTYVRAFLRV